MNFARQRLENAILYFAKEYKKRSRRPLPQTGLYKFLSLLDFKMLRCNGKPAFDLEYIAMDHGPVPTELYNNRESIKTNLFSFKSLNEKEYIIIPKENAKPDLNYFTDEELSEMQRLVTVFSSPAYRTIGFMSDESHKTIKAWVKARDRRPNSIMQYADEFEDVFEKPETELTPEEDRFLTFESFKRIKATR